MVDLTQNDRPTGQERPLILVIDDEPYILRALAYLLQREGYAVEIAANGEEGLARARALNPRIIFLDFMMPRLDGLQVLKQLRRDPELASVYVIMLTARGQKTDRDQGLAAGANEFLTKPFSPREVAQRIRLVMAEAVGPSLAGTTGG